MAGLKSKGIVGPSPSKGVMDRITGGRKPLRENGKDPVSAGEALTGSPPSDELFNKITGGRTPATKTSGGLGAPEELTGSMSENGKLARKRLLGL